MNSERLFKANQLVDKIDSLSLRIASLKFESELKSFPIGITIDTRIGTYCDKICFSFQHEYFGDISKKAWKQLHEFLILELTNELRAAKEEFQNL